MADDLRAKRSTPEPPTRPPNALVASAAILSQRRLPIPDPEAWQNEGWGFYDTTPEARFAVNWLENGLSRCRVVAARIDPSGDEPRRIERPNEEEEGQTDVDELEPLSAVESAALDLMEDLAGGPTGQANLLGACAVHLTVPGDGYLIGIPAANEQEEDRWAVYSADQIKKQGDVYVLTVGEGSLDGKEVLPPEVVVTRFWRPHRRFSWKPDSPFRAVLGVLRELTLASQAVEASLVSRLAGAGMLVLPDELMFATSDQNAEAADPFLAEFIDALTTPIRDRSAASAAVPFVVRMKGDFIGQVQYLTFVTPLDDRVLELKEAAIKRFATGIDLPAEVVLGLQDSNHWTAWQIEESAVKLHVEPMLESVCEALTIGYLHPALLAAGFSPEDISGIIVWYDATALTVRPDRSGAAQQAYEDGVIGWRAYLREIGLDPADAPDDEELKRKILLDVIKALPSSAPQLLPLLGIDLPGAPDLEPEPAPVPAEPSDEVPAPEGPPERQDEPPAAESGLAASGEDALLAAADGLVWRALERAGSRLQGKADKARLDTDCPPPTMHTCVPEDFRLEHLDGLLAGAWDRVPEVAARHNVDPASLMFTLDAYTRALLSTGWPHEYAALAVALGADYDDLAPVPALAAPVP